MQGTIHPQPAQVKDRHPAPACPACGDSANVFTYVSLTSARVLFCFACGAKFRLPRSVKGPGLLADALNRIDELVRLLRRRA